MDIEKELKLIMRQRIGKHFANEEGEVFKAIVERNMEYGVWWVATAVYNYGIVQGKREERSRRKGKKEEKPEKEKWLKIMTEQRRFNETFLDQLSLLIEQLEGVLNKVDQNLIVLERYGGKDRSK